MPRHEDTRAGNSERIINRSVNNILKEQRGLEAPVPIGLHATGPVALRAICVEVRTHARDHRRSRIHHADELGQRSDTRQCGRIAEHAIFAQVRIWLSLMPVG